MKNKNLPLVSIIMPVYNGEKYLKPAIDSILTQSYKNIELVIIDNASTDSTKKIIISYTDSRIRLIENESNFGIVYSRNKGIEQATGEYVATLDSDDIALPERIEKQVLFLHTSREYGMCGTFYNAIDSHGNFLKKIQFPTNNQDVVTHLTLGNCFGNSTIMIRSALAKELKYRQEFEIVEDYDLWYRISKRAKVSNLPFYGTSYRVHGNNVSMLKMMDMLNLVKKINGQILTDLNLDYSTDELEIHSNLLSRNIEYFQDDKHFYDLETWVLKLYDQVRNDKKFNSPLFFKLLAEKWIVIAFNTKRYKKLFVNGLIAIQRRSFLACLYRRVRIKVMKSKGN